MLAVRIRPRILTATINRQSQRKHSWLIFLGMMKQAAQLQSKMQAMQEELGHVRGRGQFPAGGLITVADDGEDGSEGGEDRPPR